jgi:hypothetical protein
MPRGAVTRRTRIRRRERLPKSNPADGTARMDLESYLAATTARGASARRDWKGRLLTTSRTSVWSP